MVTPAKPRQSLYVIPPGCICMGDGMLGMKCEALEHARMRENLGRCVECEQVVDVGEMRRTGKCPNCGDGFPMEVEL